MIKFDNLYQKVMRSKVKEYQTTTINGESVLLTTLKHDAGSVVIC